MCAVREQDGLRELLAHEIHQPALRFGNDTREGETEALQASEDATNTISADGDYQPGLGIGPPGHTCARG